MELKRTIRKQELAGALFPDSISETAAIQLLRREIRNTPPLKERLFKDRSNRLHHFTKEQVAVLLEHFHVTKEEFKDF